MLELKGDLKPDFGSRTPSFLNFNKQASVNEPNMTNLGLMIRELPADSIWSAAGIGKYRIKMNAMAMIAGGGVRVGSKIMYGMMKKEHTWPPPGTGGKDFGYIRGVGEKTVFA